MEGLPYLSEYTLVLKNFSISHVLIPPSSILLHDPEPEQGVCRNWEAGMKGVDFQLSGS